jgi:hypothetical protein
MPRMYDWLVTALNEHHTSVTPAFAHPAFNLLDRQRLKNVADALLPASVSRR